MKRNTMTYALVTLMVLTAIAAMAAQGKRGQQQPKMNGGGPAACQQMLGLSQSQKDALATIKASFTDETAGLKTELQAKMKEIAGLWAVAEPNLTQIKTASADADEIRAQIRDKAIDAKGAALKVLTTEQRAICLKQCQGGQCGFGMFGGPEMGMGMGQGMKMGGPDAAGMCPKGNGNGMGMGAGGKCGSGGCPMQR